MVVVEMMQGWGATTRSTSYLERSLRLVVLEIIIKPVWLLRIL